jgi:uncharacterized protein YrrD
MVMLTRCENVLEWCDTFVTGLEDVNYGSEMVLLACRQRNSTKMRHVCLSVCRVLPIFNNNVAIKVFIYQLMHKRDALKEY